MKVAFLTETTFNGKYPVDFPNARTEIAWMIALNADHFNIYQYGSVVGYDHVFVIIPKGRTFLSSDGCTIMTGINPASNILDEKFNLIPTLKSVNIKVHFVQEGPHWWFNDYSLIDQIAWYNAVSQCDSIFAHNDIDVKYYKGLFPNMPVQTIGTLMLDNLIESIIPAREDKVIIGGNFARWYGGFESYIVARNFELPMWAQTSHARREGEESMENLTHFPRMYWLDWMTELSKFKYAVHLMPTVAAGTFSLNCAYFGIPCIGNKDMDTQRICHGLLSVDVNDVAKATELAIRLKTDPEFYEYCSDNARYAYQNYYSVERWTDDIKKYL